MEKKYSAGEIAGFLVPSIIGILLFMVPVQYEGTWTIIIKIVADIIGEALTGFLPALCVIIVTASATLGVASLGKPSFITSYPLVNETTALTENAKHNINDFQSLWYANVVDEISVQYPLLAQGTITPEQFAQALTDAALKN